MIGMFEILGTRGQDDCVAYRGLSRPVTKSLAWQCGLSLPSVVYSPGGAGFYEDARCKGTVNAKLMTAVS
jgi:hypothetical protein